MTAARTAPTNVCVKGSCCIQHFSRLVSRQWLHTSESGTMGKGIQQQGRRVGGPTAPSVRYIRGPIFLRHAVHHVRGRRARSRSPHCFGLRYSLWQPPQLDSTFGHSALNVASSLMLPAAALASAASLSKRAKRSAFFAKASGL